MTTVRFMSIAIAFLWIGCSGYRNVSTYTKAPDKGAAASAADEDVAATPFSTEDVNSMVTAASTQADQAQTDAEAASDLQEAMTPETAAFADSEMADAVESSFADEANGAANNKVMQNAKALIKNLAVAAKNGKRKKVQKIAAELLKLIDKNAAGNDAQDQAKAGKKKVGELVKKIVQAANKNKKDDLKKFLKDLVALLKK